MEVHLKRMVDKINEFRMQTQNTLIIILALTRKRKGKCTLQVSGLAI